MFQSIFKTAFRSLNRNRRHALLNILGLSVAMAACIVIFLVLQYEFSFNNYISKGDQLYQVVTRDVDAAGEHYTSGTPFPACDYMRKDFPQYTIGQFIQNYGVQVTAKGKDGALTGKKFIERNGVFYAEPQILEIFEVKVLQGTAATLDNPYAVLLSEKLATKYFGSPQQAMGMRLNFDNEKEDYQVTGIFQEPPSNTDFPFLMIKSYEGFKRVEGNNWGITDWGATTSSHQIFVRLPDASKADVFGKYVAGIQQKYNKEQKDNTRTHFLNPLAAVHFDERFGSMGDHTSSKKSLYSLAFIGLLIILMACINYVNLSTALAVKRSKEVGIRKVMGGSAGQLRSQIFAETLLVVLSAAVVAIALAWLALPYVKNFMVVQDKLNLFNPGVAIFLILSVLITAFLSGVYPAFIMGRFKPVEAIKNRISTTKLGSVSLRRVLVVLQFAFSQILIIATILAVSQMSYIQHADLGFNKESVLLLSGNADSVYHSRREALKAELVKRSDVKSLSFSFDAPSSENSWQSNFAFDIMEDRPFSTNIKMADDQYMATYDIKMAAGRMFAKTDTLREYVINETMVRKVGLKSPQDAIGKMLRLGGTEPRPVVGVVKDFKMQSLREEVPPIVLYPNQRWYVTAGIKVQSGNLLRARDEIEQIWNRIYPEYVYNAAFLDENINNFYLQEKRISTMYKIYALLAIFISCLGLYGLVSFMVVQKTKEVGIRKVLGAGVGSIVYLFSREFSLLIGVAFVLAAPAAAYLMHQWLKDFAYRIDMGPLVFVIALMASLFIAWITVGYKAIRAARANPVKSLRSE